MIQEKSVRLKEEKICSGKKFFLYEDMKVNLHFSEKGTSLKEAVVQYLTAVKSPD